MKWWRELSTIAIVLLLNLTVFGNELLAQNETSVTADVAPITLAAELKGDRIDVTVDGVLVPGDSKRGTGIVPNPLMLEDTSIGNVCLTDPIGGSSSFFDTPVVIKSV